LLSVGRTEANQFIDSFNEESIIKLTDFILHLFTSKFLIIPGVFDRRTSILQFGRVIGKTRWVVNGAGVPLANAGSIDNYRDNKWERLIIQAQHFIKIFQQKKITIIWEKKLQIVFFTHGCG
jgi:hypothetical protein